jgi:hypothetical protein
MVFLRYLKGVFWQIFLLFTKDLKACFSARNVERVLPNAGRLGQNM